MRCTVVATAPPIHLMQRGRRKACLRCEPADHFPPKPSGTAARPFHCVRRNLFGALTMRTMSDRKVDQRLDLEAQYEELLELRNRVAQEEAMVSRKRSEQAQSRMAVQTFRRPKLLLQ